MKNVYTIRKEIEAGKEQVYIEALKDYKSILCKQSWCKDLKVSGDFEFISCKYNKLDKEARLFRIYYSNSCFILRSKKLYRSFRMEEIPTIRELRKIINDHLKLYQVIEEE